MLNTDYRHRWAMLYKRLREHRNKPFYKRYKSRRETLDMVLEEMRQVQKDAKQIEDAQRELATLLQRKEAK